MSRTESRASDMFGYLLHQKEKLLTRLETELTELTCDTDTQLELAKNKLERKIGVASEAIYHLVRERKGNDLAKMRALKLTREKEMIENALKGMKSTAALIEKAKVVQSAKLGLVSSGVKQDQHCNLLQISSRLNKAKEMATQMTAFLSQQAHAELTHSNFEERVKEWRGRIQKYSILHMQLAPICATYRCSLDSLEANTMKMQIQGMFRTLQEKTISACIEKYGVTLHSNQRLSVNITQLLIQQAETRSRKHTLKIQLVKLRDDIQVTRSPKVCPTNKEIFALQKLVIDTISMCKSILAKIDRTDPRKLLGPHVEDLELAEPSLTDHCVALLLVTEKKVKMIETVLKQRIDSIASVQSDGLWEKPALKIVNLKLTSQGVNNIKRNIYTSHFVEDGHTGQVDSLLSGVAHVQFQMTSGFRHIQSNKGHFSPIPISNDTENEEISYLKRERLRKKGMKESVSSSPLRRNQRSNLYRKPAFLNNPIRYKSNLELLTGIPNITQNIHELSKSANLFQQSGEQSLKEMYQELVSKKCGTNRIRLRKMKKDGDMKRSGSGGLQFPRIRISSGSPRNRGEKKGNFLIAPMTDSSEPRVTNK